MKAIKEKMGYALAVTLLCLTATVFLVCKTVWHASALFAGATTVMSIVTVQCFRTYRNAKIISENPILSVGVASVSGSGVKTDGAVNVIISGFGVLMDGKPYKYGYGGIRLTSVEIDRESVNFSFGNDEKRYNVRLLHGISDSGETEKLVRRLKYETGVTASVRGW